MASTVCERLALLISTRSFASGAQAYATWRRRWRIENNGFRELKEGWHLEAAPWSYTDATMVEARVTFTCVAFNVAQLAKTAAGRRLIEAASAPTESPLNLPSVSPDLSESQNT